MKKAETQFNRQKQKSQTRERSIKLQNVIVIVL